MLSLRIPNKRHGVALVFGVVLLTSPLIHGLMFPSLSHPTDGRFIGGGGGRVQWNNMPNARGTSASALWALDGSDFESMEEDGSASFSEGEAMAKDFYKQLRLREEGEEEDENDFKQRRQEKRVELSEEEVRLQNRKAFVNRKEVREGRDIPTPLKFTGTQSQNDSSPPGGSSGFFKGNGGSVFSVPVEQRRGGSSSNNNDARTNMMQSEFDLVSGFSSERAILIQAVIVISLLAFAISIGLSGGITDGSERYIMEDPTEFSTSVESALDQISSSADKAAISTDQSVWL
mmetsp:Transcript_25902/g.46928  ORF Transcript_25902/g.46928 Transcript_25902/m.46928 type:complete len:289 (-) Transcript_25902:352-1218(-)|eukprot:CAMPEP_0198280222 /NCGR_PEP_ID=MMETSP1449-20131203/343_1 /TAXON_ID=420275 /ORGANISM="Attheya septentrionalis, Strain CCMP2084" /LENGTH=288 /DNA_ID=CAMNT_0043975513 /DNA_START=266 /DNA_END=1132 /DNA_ORIENTATION=+